MFDLPLFTENYHETGGEVKNVSKIDDERILAALIACGSVRAAAKSVNISESTIRNKLKDPAFREKYDKLRVEMLQEAAQGLTARLGDATETLSSIMGDTKSPATVRCSAADSILRFALRYVEAADILRRLDALEQSLKEVENE